MSSGRRGGRGGGERGGRGARGGNNSPRGGTGRGNNNHPVAQTRSTPNKHDSPRGGASRGASDGRNSFRGRGSPKTNPFSAATNTTTNANFKSNDPMNSTPFPAHEYQKRLEYLRARRPAVKNDLIAKGLMDREGQIKLSERVEKYGLCTDMCSEFERVRRIVEQDVKAPECTPETARKKRDERIPDESRMVKAHTRSAAGAEEELLTDVRTPDTCLRTLKYLWTRLDAEGLDFLYAFVWDRTRSVRKDLGLNKIRRGELGTYLQCVEQCARFHLLSLHQMASSASTSYNVHTDRGNDIEQLKNCMTSLRFYYKTVYEVNVNFLNRAEFLAYDLILSFAWGERMAPETRKSLEEKYRTNRRVMTALAIVGAGTIATSPRKDTLAAQRQLYVDFWKLIQSPSVSYLMACAAELSFKSIRHHALRTLRKACKPPVRREGQPFDDLDTTTLMEPLGFDNTEQVREFCEAYGFSFTTKADGQEYLDLNSLPYHGNLQDRSPEVRDQYYLETFVESKRHGRTHSALIQGLSIKEARTKGLLDVEAMKSAEAHGVTNDVHGLFVPQEPSAVSAQKTSVFGPTSFGVGTGAEKPALNPFAAPFNPITPKAPPLAASSVPTTTTKPNPFLMTTAQNGGSTPAAPTSVQPGLFDPAKHSIQFTTSSASQASPLAQAPTTNPFQPAAMASTAPNPFASLTAAAPATASPSARALATTSPFVTTPSTAMVTASASQPWTFPNSANANLAGVSAASSSPGLFALQKKPTPNFSFATPPQPLITAEQEVLRKAQEQQRILDEQRRAEEERRLAAEQRQIEEHRRRLLQEEMEHRARAAEIERQEELAVKRRQAELDAMRQAEAQRQAEEQRKVEEQREAEEQRGRLFNALATSVLMDPNNGCMGDYLRVRIKGITANVRKELEDQRRVEEAERGRQQRQLQLARWVCEHWYRWTQKRLERRAHRRARRELREEARQLEEERKVEEARKAEEGRRAEETRKAKCGPERTEWVQQKVRKIAEDRPNHFKKPEIPARKDTTPEVITVAQQVNAKEDEIMRRPNTATRMAKNASMNSLSSSVANDSYSEEYYKSKAPSDRTQTDWFEIKAMGLDPSKYRKRSFGSVSSNDEAMPALGLKRARHSSSSSFRHSLPLPKPPSMSYEGLTERFNAVRMRSRASEVRRSSTSRNRPIPESTAAVIQNAHNVLAEMNRPKSPGPSTFGRSTSVTPLGELPDFYNRPSRFVPYHLYGKGAEAVLKYREEMLGLSTPSKQSTPQKAPLNLASPMPTQQSYVPTGETQHEYEGSLEHVYGDDADGENEGAEDEEEEEHDGDSLVDYGDEVEEEEQDGSGFEEFEEEYDSEEEGEEDESVEDPQQFAQKPGATQDDAIELSD